MPLPSVQYSSCSFHLTALFLIEDKHETLAESQDIFLISYSIYFASQRACYLEERKKYFSHIETYNRFPRVSLIQTPTQSYLVIRRQMHKCCYPDNRLDSIIYHGDCCNMPVPFREKSHFVWY